MSDALTFAKLATQFVSGLGAQKLVRDALGNNVHAQNALGQGLYWIGSFVIGSIVADAATEHAGTKFDKAVAWLEERKEEAKSSS